MYMHTYIQDIKLFKEKISLTKKALLLLDIFQDQSKYKQVEQTNI